MTTPERLDMILKRFPPVEWFSPEHLPIVASVRHDPPGKWGEVRAIFKDAGGNPFDLEKAVDAWIKSQPVSSTKEERPRFKTISARDLLAKELPPQEWVIPGILTVGATLFTGWGKDGKSLMVWNICLAVATGGTALSQYDVAGGDVLYMESMENLGIMPRRASPCPPRG